MNKPQTEHCLKYISIMQGMVSETRSKTKLLIDKLHAHPDFFEEIQKDVGSLEGEIDAIKLALEFIDQFPELVDN